MLIRIILAQLLKFENTLNLFQSRLVIYYKSKSFYLSFLLKFNLKKDLFK